jgi:hypothetical protein
MQYFILCREGLKRNKLFCGKTELFEIGNACEFDHGRWAAHKNDRVCARGGHVIAQHRLVDETRAANERVKTADKIIL